MPITSATVRFVLSGKIGGSQTWSTGVWWSSPTQTVPMESSELAGNLVKLDAPIANAWTIGFAAQNSPQTVLQQVTAYSYGPTDRTAHAVATRSLEDLVGAASSVRLPTYTSVVASLRTASSGRRYRGRMYWPLDAASLTPDHRISSTICDQIARAVSGFIDGVNTQVSVPGAPNPTGHVMVKSVTGGTLTPVTDLVVDDLPDTQHRREDKVGSVYQSRRPIEPFTPA